MNTKLTNLLLFCAIIIAWLFTYFYGVTTAIAVWNASEIFTHCFFVIPGACYLIFQKRKQVLQQPIKSNYWLIIPLIGTLVLYTFGHVGDIRLFMHVAAFTSLPILIWMFIGNRAAKHIAFPLYFMLFSIPVGEQLIPYLQELTTDLAVPLIELSGVPVFRNGLYLDIPAGRFLVAEACSGISFLIASIMFGNLYAYLAFKQIKKQILFVFISILVPILANAIRVFGIVLTAHLTDMEYAAGADHIIYGGVFYAIVLFLLIFIGEKFRDQDLELSLNDQNDSPETVQSKLLWSISTFTVFIFTLQFLWVANIEDNVNVIEKSKSLINLNVLPFEIKETKLLKWQPSFSDADKIKQGSLNIKENINIDFFIAAYVSGKGELISSLNKLYDADRWTLVSQRIINIQNVSSQAMLTQVASPLGKKRFIIHWYQIGDNSFTSRVKAKLFQTSNLLLGKNVPSGLIAFSLQTDKNSMLNNQALNKLTLNEFVADNAQAIHNILLNE